MQRACVPTDMVFTFWNSALQRAGSFRAQPSMKLFVQSTMIFFGTLIAAALVALGAPADAEVQMATQTAPGASVVSLLGLDD
jgi:hypothetical protein